jgi:murein DD-endopeptidase MepM/ murein hydrolase activator NlpD
MMILTYTPSDGDTLFDISSRLMLPYATLATLNRLDDTRIDRDNTILVPTQPGLFVYETPKSRLEELIVERLDTAEAGIPIIVPDSNVAVTYYEGADFSPAERRLFLQVTFDDPLEIGVVSSRYGYRNHPITGVWSHHNGIDLAADFGEPVRTAAEGRVSSITRDPWLGLSITIDHADDYQTLYAHLQESFVAVGTIVERGATIGTVGSTGLSTGPHLHFEILYRGENRDPVRFLPRELQ